ncbi:GNAT family N-acetyltransferase [Nocardia sp. ET3-3]|uniref:GNAT family N-acetyltransferase n=1 Tax=Nocardia terrae TaxID=2675851 RepID=A0A7K1UVN1_9NOCA|nr:GNAT family N-acetyltransferase [Nocardia terrae]
MQIRPGTESDAEAVAMLHTASWRTAYAHIMPGWYLNGSLADDHRNLWRTRLAAEVPAGSLFIAESDGEMRGFVYLAAQPDGRVLIDNLHVQPDHKGGGIGGQLLHFGFEWAGAEYPGHSVYLEVLQDNTAAIGFYKRHGGQPGEARIAHFSAGFDVYDLEITWSQP